MKFELRRGDVADPRAVAAGEEAERWMGEGRCCAEAIVLATIDRFAPDAPRGVAAAAAGLCGGMGNQRATCGVYTGGALAIGLLPGGRDARALKGLSAGFQERLAAEAGALECGELRRLMGWRNLTGGRCRELTARGAELLAEMVIADGAVSLTTPEERDGNK